MNADRDKYIMQALEITAKLTTLAEEGEAESKDDGCRVLFGIVRDCAYNIRMHAEKESERHRVLKDTER
jgi:hypothetical protein